MSAGQGFTPLSIITDVDQGFPFDRDNVLSGEAHLGAVGILRNATTEGRAGIVIRVDLPDGTQVLAQTTWRLFSAAARALAASPIGSQEVLD